MYHIISMYPHFLLFRCSFIFIVFFQNTKHLLLVWGFIYLFIFPTAFSTDQIVPTSTALLLRDAENNRKNSKRKKINAFQFSGSWKVSLLLTFNSPQANLFYSQNLYKPLLFEASVKHS